MHVLTSFYSKTTQIVSGIALVGLIYDWFLAVYKCFSVDSEGLWQTKRLLQDRPCFLINVIVLMTSLSDSSRPVRRYVTSAMSSQSQVISAKAEVHFNNYQIPSSEPWIEITEQPISNALRFRYQCEGRSAGSLLGQSSTNDQKVFPTIAVSIKTFIIKRSIFR